MRPAGFSTGALLGGDFRGALRLLESRPAVVELSALRLAELPALLQAFDRGELDLASLTYVSVHAPSRYPPAQEEALAATLRDGVPAPLPVVLHPDAVAAFTPWEALGDRLLIENMDLRKRTGQTAAQLSQVFARLPRAGLCLDLGHAHQVDPTLGEARRILDRFADRLRQVHLSEVDDAGRHRPLGDAVLSAFRQVAHLIPEQVPVILETPVGAGALAAELGRAQAALPAGATGTGS